MNCMVKKVIDIDNDTQEEDKLININKNIAEIKKKIQLSEGQRKAYYEECNEEKKNNVEKIKTLKKLIEDLQMKMGKPRKVALFNEFKFQETKEFSSFRNKSIEQVAELLDEQVINLQKKQDLLLHNSNMLKEKLNKLAREYNDIQQRIEFRESEEQGQILLAPRRIAQLENQIHRIELNTLEAEHMKKKYRSIRGNLLEDSVGFESTLKRLEDSIAKQEEEIEKLEGINVEALGLRDVTRGLMIKQEQSANEAVMSRDVELQEARYRMEMRRIELERLERYIFPSTSRALASVVRPESSPVESERKEIASPETTMNQLEVVFEKLKKATGELEVEMVLQRFLAQKESKTRLNFLKSSTEQEKKELDKKRDGLIAKLEAFKFSEAKDKEQNVEEIERLKNLIEEQKKQKILIEGMIQRNNEQYKEIQKILFNLYQRFENFKGNILLQMDKISTEEMIRALEVKIRSLMTEVAKESKLLVKPSLEMEAENPQEISIIDFDDPWSSPPQAPRIPPIVSTGQQQQQQQHSKQEESSKPTTIPSPCVISDSESEPEEVPSRAFLKRQAQLIVDARSRRKQFNVARRN